MATDPQILISRYLDGLLSEDEFKELTAWIAEKPEHATQFAQASLLHDRLRNHFRARMELVSEKSQAQRVAAQRDSMRILSRWKGVAFLVSSAAVILVVFLIFHGGSGESARAAEMELKRLIHVTERISDCTYLITALDEGKVEDRPKKGGLPQPPINGAILYRRGPGQYVLVRKFPDGSEFITGSDGKTSWSCPPVQEGKKGPAVRVSNDPLRFRGPVPGQQHNIPFLDIRNSLDQLREAYTLTFLPSRPGPDGNTQWNGIRADRREDVAGGPKHVEIWYVPETGVIQKMRFDGMPRAKGGPRSLLVELMDQRDLGPNFFDHTAHHGPERRVLSADE